MEVWQLRPFRDKPNQFQKNFRLFYIIISRLTVAITQTNDFRLKGFWLNWPPVQISFTAHSPVSAASSGVPTRRLKRWTDAKPWKLVSLSGKPSIFTPAKSGGFRSLVLIFFWKISTSSTNHFTIATYFWGVKKHPNHTPKDQTAGSDWRILED